MEPKVEQWMLDAIEELWDHSLLLECEKPEALAIIASHAPGNALAELKRLGPYERDSEAEHGRR